MKLVKYSSLTLTSILLLMGGAMSCSSFGKKPAGEHLEKISKSKHYDSELKKFKNPGIDLSKNEPKMWPILKEYIFGPEIREPKQKLPEVKPNISEFLVPSPELKFIWLGHSSFLVNIDQKIILFDPVFSNSISPVKIMGSRFQAPVLTLQELPPIDYIVISHDHYDHLDEGSIKFFKDKQTKFLTPLGVGSYMVGWGIDRNRITELDWWQTFKVNDLEFVCTPSQHFSGRTSSFGNPTLWASWVVKNKKSSLYYSGDSGYGPHFKEIGEKYGPFDLTFMENGQYSEKWPLVHMLPKEVAQAHIDLKGSKMVPVHWGMFNLSLHNWFDPIEEAVDNSKTRGTTILTPMIGELVNGQESKTSYWWKDLLPKAQTKALIGEAK